MFPRLAMVLSAVPSCRISHLVRYYPTQIVGSKSQMLPRKAPSPWRFTRRKDAIRLACSPGTHTGGQSGPQPSMGHNTLLELPQLVLGHADAKTGPSGLDSKAEQRLQMQKWTAAMILGQLQKYLAHTPNTDLPVTVSL